MARTCAACDGNKVVFVDYKRPRLWPDRWMKVYEKCAACKGEGVRA